MKKPLLSPQKTPGVERAHQAAPGLAQTQPGLIQLQHLIGNRAINRLFSSLRPSQSAPARQIARKPAGVNMALRGRGRVATMSDDDISLKLSGSVGSGRAQNAPADVRLVQQKLRQLDYLSADDFATESPAPTATQGVPSSQLPQTIMAIRAFQRHAMLTSNTDGRIDPGGMSNKLLDVEDQGVENTAKRAADEITSLFESGGDYSEIFLKDYGVVSYGKHQATLAAGTLYTLLNQFVTDHREKSDYARRVESYLPRVKSKDESLADDSAFISLLKDAGRSDPCMQTAQDDFFDQHYGGQARKRMGKAGVTSALAYAFFYDSQIHGGIDYDLSDTIKVLGGTVGQTGKDGSIITEDAFMKEMTKQRQERNAAAGQKQLKRAEEKRKEADVLEAAGKIQEARAKRASAAKDEKNGTALTHSANDPKGRLGMWRNWADKGDLDLSGDDNGMLMVKGTPVLGLRSGATLRGNGSQSVAPDSSTPSNPQTASPTSSRSTPAPQTTSTPTTDQTQSSAPGFIRTMFGQLEHTLDFFGKAHRSNLKYSKNPPLPGWPYRRELKALWDSGNFNEFAVKVLSLQTNLLGLSSNDKDADGILGKKTARAILNASRPEFLIDEANTVDDEIEMDPVDVSTPAGTQSANPTTIAPTTRSTTVAPTPQSANQPAPTPQSTAPQPEAAAPSVRAGNDLGSVQAIINPLRGLYRNYESLNLNLRSSYGVFSNDGKLSALRWKMIRLKFLSGQEETKKQENKTLAKGLQKELEKLKAENTKSPFSEQLETLIRERNAVPISKRNPESAAESFRKKNPDRIKAERALVTAIAEARQQIAGLSDATLRAAAYLELNKYTPYHYQMENMDALYNSEAAGGRTCNVTSVSMVLEALGKSPSHYKGKDGAGFNAERMKIIATHFDSTLKDHGESVNANEMRMPDFMQLVAIDMSLGTKEATPENIDAARWLAADSILMWDFLQQILKAFGTKTDARSHQESEILTVFGGMTLESKNLLDNEDAAEKKGTKGAEEQAKTGQTYASTVSLLDAPLKTLQNIGADVPAADVKTLITSAIASVKSIQTANASSKTFKGAVANQVLSDLNAALKSFNEKKLTEDQQRAKAISRLKQVDKTAKTYSSGGSMEAMQTVLSVDAYKSGFLTQVSKAMKEGNQVVLNLYNHFVRLQSIEEDGFVVDDPGRYTNEAMHVSWAKGIAAGYFRSYTIVKP